MSTVPGSTLSSITEGITHNGKETNGEKCYSKTLVGREKETAILVKAYESVKKNETFESVLVHGNSGTGKTSLVLAFREIVCHRKDFFCMGKYFQNTEPAQEPYSAIMEAFSDLCDLVIQSTDKERRNKIQEELGSNGQFLVRLVTNISPLLKSDPNFDIFETMDESVFAKFKSACKIFLKALSSNEHIIVLFLDDIQWMDSGSLVLVKFLLQARDMKNMMLIFAARDEELEYIESFKKEINVHISLRNLENKSIEKMISLFFGDRSIDHHILSTIIAHKTEGNLFHIIEFLESIERKGLIKKSHGLLIFDVEAIKRKIMVSDSLAKWLSQKVYGINSEMQQILKMASLLGYRFGESILFDATSQLYPEKNDNKFSIESMRVQLENAVGERFLETIHEGYQFVHDKIQIEFQHLMDNQERCKFQLIIGRVHLTQSEANSKYLAAIHLNKALNAPNDGRENYFELARINRDASKYCEERSAFVDAIYFLEKGLSLFNENDRWLNTYDLAIEMTESLAKMEFIVGNFDMCHTINQELLLQTISTELKTNVIAREINIQLLSHQSIITTTSKKIIRQLGIYFPRVVTPWILLNKLRRVRKILKKKSDEDVLSITTIEEPEISTGIRLLVMFFGDSLVRKKMLLAVYSILAAVETTLTVGLSPYSSIAVCQFAIVEGILGHENQGCRLAELSLKLLQLNPEKQFRCAVTINAALFSLFRKKYLRDCIESIPKALSDLFDIGASNQIGYCLCMHFVIQLSLGSHLQEVERIMHKFHDQLSDFCLEFNLLCIQPLMQAVINLRSQSENWKELIILTGDIMNEEEFTKIRDSEIDALNLYVLYCKMLLAFLFRFHKEGYSLGKKLNDSAHPLFEKSFLSIPQKFYFLMISYKLYHSTRKRKYLRTARKCKNFLVRLHSHGNPNIRPYLAVINAEELYMNSTDALEINKAYSTAIEIAKTEGLSHLEALANEHAGLAFSQLGYPITANKYFAQAKSAYRYRWGATAKYRWLVVHTNPTMMLMPDVTRKVSVNRICERITK
mmetsp:Transcript_19075/g.21822  ORF Transcript_19075/g.21822 Transcript_19075/m.21822 type:complete len:1032 (-) Transcript_19075:68-3163(-)